jgi:hypothetical protein
MHAAAHRHRLLSVDEWRQVDVEPGMPDLELLVAPGPIVKGRVVDEVGMPVRRFNVSSRFVASNEGVFEFQLDQVGPVEIVVFAPGSPRVVTPLQAKPGTVQDLGTIVLPHGTLLAGVVVDADTGEPISGAQVKAANTGDEAWTDGDGTLSLTVGPSPSLRITAKNYQATTFETETAGSRFALHALQ